MEWFSYILEHPEKRWHWWTLSMNPNITTEIIMNHSDLPWNYTYLSNYCKHIITPELIQQTYHKRWTYTIVSALPCIHWNFITENPQIPWCYNGLSENPNITWDIVDANPERPWNYLTLCHNLMNGKHTPKARIQKRAQVISNELSDIYNDYYYN